MHQTALTPERLELLRTTAASDVLDHIARDAEHASPTLAALLLTIQKRLHEPDFNVDALWKAHGIRDHSAAERFKELHTTPSAYIRDRRLDIARNVLAHHPSLPLWELPALCGFASQKTLTRAFRRAFATTPHAYRQAHAVESPYFTSATLQDRVDYAFNHRATNSEAADLYSQLTLLLARLTDRYSLPHHPHSSLFKSGYDYELHHSKEVLPLLLSTPVDKRSSLLRSSLTLATSAFYDLLLEHAKNSLPPDKVRYTDLALTVLEVNQSTIPSSTYSTLLPQAHAWAGNSHRLVADFLSAEDHFLSARAALHATKDEQAHGLVAALHGQLRSYQGRLSEALDFCGTALTTFLEVRDHEHAFRTLNTIAEAHLFHSQTVEALHALQRAYRLLPSTPISERHLLNLHMQSCAHYRAGRIKDARTCTQELQTALTSNQLPLPPWFHKVHWLRGNLFVALRLPRKALPLYASTWNALRARNDYHAQALLLLDVALLHLDHETPSQPDVLTCLRDQVLPLLTTYFSSIRLTDHSIVTGLLQRDLSTSTLAELRKTLNTDPLSSLARPDQPLQLSPEALTLLFPRPRGRAKSPSRSSPR